MATHNFLLISNINIDDRNDINNTLDNYYSGNNKNIYNEVKIHDDILIYIMDTLKFIKCKWVSGEIKSGIDYYGYSLINSEESYKAKIIFESWKNIFEQAEEEIKLTGEYYWTEEQNKGEYEKLIINKKEIINKLDTLINMCDTAYKEGYHILHLGI